MRSRLLPIYAFCLATVLPASQPPHNTLLARIEALRIQFPSVLHGRLGFRFVDLQTGVDLASQDASTFFTPASNTKLYTTAAALVRLGAGYRMETQLRASGPWQPGQPDIDDLLLVGGGDPNLSGRTLPYQVDAQEGDPLAALRDLADRLWNAGVRTIRGNVAAVAQRYVGTAYPDGWTIDDSDFSYGAPVSALTLNDNSVALILRPAAETGELAEIELRPPTAHFHISNQVATVPGREAHITLQRPGASNELVLRGSIGQALDQWRQDVAVDDPSLWAAMEFVHILRERGILVRGFPALCELPATASTLLVSRPSAPLSEIIRVTNKVSQNLHAEMLLRELAAAMNLPGTMENGLKERLAFLREAGVTTDGTGFALADGSGLARQDLTTPDSTIALLRYMWNRPEREVWLRSLPVGALDGSLQKRFRNIAGAQRIHAKTGSISHVNALSGYLETRGGGWLAFSVMVNATAGREADVRLFIDRLCALFLDR